MMDGRKTILVPEVRIDTMLLNQIPDRGQPAIGNTPMGLGNPGSSKADTCCCMQRMDP
jgi:hypothetical protein